MITALAVMMKTRKSHVPAIQKIAGALSTDWHFEKPISC